MSAFRVRKTLIQCCWSIGCLLTVVYTSQAQSLDPRFPKPVRTNEVVGRIGARDIGDARLTDHFYALTGTPGDLLITIETRNLNGDIDIFTAGALRPVLKLVLYAEVTAPVTKSIFLRSREDLILRVEARTPNDDDGMYHIRFSGSFEPIAAVGNDEEGSELATAAPVIRKGKRVSSVGARVDEPAPPPLEVAEIPRPEPTPLAGVDPPPLEPRPSEPPAVEPKVVEAPSSSTGRTTASRASTRRGRGRPVPKEENPPKQVSEEAKEGEARTTAEEIKSEPEREISEKPVAPARKSSKRSKRVTTEPVERSETSSNESAPAKSESTARTRPKPSPVPTVSEEAPTAVPPEDLSKSKLIIEMLDGTRIERFMTTIRRVDVQNGQIVVTASDGTVERIRLARVLRMTIGQ